MWSRLPCLSAENKTGRSSRPVLRVARFEYY